MSENQKVVEINPDVATSKTKAFFARHKTKLVGTAITAGTVAVFIAGRRSKDLVESVDVDIQTPDSED